MTNESKSNSLQDLQKELLQNPDLSKFEHATLQALTQLDRSEKSLETSEKKTRFVATLAVTLLLLVLVLVFYREHTADRRLAKTIDGFTKMETVYKHDDLDYKGQKDLFRKTMGRIRTVHTKEYISTDIQALNDKQYANWVNLCFDLAFDLGGQIDRFDGPIVSILESDINPNAVGPLGEKGLYGMMGIRAWACYGHYLAWPENLRKKYPIKYTESDDCFDYFTATVLFYADMHASYKAFKNSEAWVYTAWKWGPTVLARHFAGGNGRLPLYFVYNGVKYSVDAYWTAALALKESFRIGKTKPGKPIARKWKKVADRIRREEEEFLREYGTWKSLNKRVIKLEKSEQLKEAEIVSLKKDIKSVYDRYVKKLGEIKKGDYKSVEEVFKDSWDIIWDWTLKYTKSQNRKILTQWVLLIIIVLLFLGMVGYLLVMGFITTKNKIKMFFKKRMRRKDGS